MVLNIQVTIEYCLDLAPNLNLQLLLHLEEELSLLHLHLIVIVLTTEMMFNHHSHHLYKECKSIINSRLFRICEELAHDGSTIKLSSSDTHC